MSMGIYIPNMEMPKEIEPAIVIDFCEDLDGKRYARFYHYRYGGLTDWHEILEVPEPHGRLGDLDELARKIEHDQYNHTHTDGLAARHHIAEYGHFLREIVYTPTIIPAEEGK